MVPSTGIVQYAIRMIGQNGGEITNVRHAEYDLAGSTANSDLLALVLEFIVGLLPTIMAHKDSRITGQEYRVAVYNAITGLFDPAGVVVSALVGGIGANAMPGQTALLGFLRSENPRSTGRLYGGGFTEATNTNDAYFGLSVSGAMAVYCYGLTQQFIQPVTGMELNPGVWSRKDTVLYPHTGIVNIRTIPSSQRRRQRGVGS